MAVITDFLTGEWANAFGWTLFHSLWQSLLIVLIVKVCLRRIPALRSGLRYAVACGGLLLLTLSSVFTFVYLMTQEPAPGLAGQPIREIAIAYNAEDEKSSIVSALTNVTATIHENMPLILALWVTGFLLFVCRLGGGLLYTEKLRSEARPLENEWNEFIGRAGQKLRINRLVSLAESAVITTPMVIGHLKPVILVPAGMLTGLSTEQLETIFLHELAHIRRHDYIVNLMQSIVEAVFFFNPFVRSLSNVIRCEREYCCDDLVIRHHGSARVYAHALVQLAEMKHFTPGFAIPLAGERNQLLNRIRRIMEKSVKNYPGRNRILAPAILLVSGLLCISWLGIQENKGPQEDSTLTEQDTVIPDKGNSQRKENMAWYSRRSILTIDENGQPHEEIIEQFEGDEDLRPLLKKGIPSVPDSSPFTPPSALFPDPVLPHLPMIPDTIPPAPGFKDEEQWEEFSNAFEENFRMDFDALFSFRNENALKLMEELEESFRLEDWRDSTRSNLRFPQEAFEQLKGLPDEAWFDALAERLRRFEAFNMERLRRFEREFERDSARHKGTFQDALREELIKDGYLSENESIQGLEWTDDVFKINGEEIKGAHAEKYRELSRQYSNRRPLERLE